MDTQASPVIADQGEMENTNFNSSAISKKVRNRDKDIFERLAKVAEHKDKKRRKSS